jgi:cytochrome P450
MVDAETGERMTDRQLRDEAMSLFVSGYETTSTTLSWAFHALLERPALLRELEEHIQAALGNKAPGFTDLPRLSLAMRIVQETLRLYTPTYFLPRVAIKDDELDGFAIPAGTTVGLMLYIIHRHPELWEEPLRFDPGRFTPERSVNRDALAWIPFGSGQRVCLAKDFALMEGQLILTRVVQRYHIEPVPGRVTRLHIATTVQTRNGVWARLARRSSTTAE